MTYTISHKIKEALNDKIVGKEIEKLNQDKTNEAKLCFKGLAKEVKKND